MFENLEKSKYSMGYDPKFVEQSTINIVEAIKEALLDGYTKNTVANLLSQELDFKSQYAHALTGKVFTMIVNDKEKREDGMKQKNIARLERIYARAVDNNDLKNAISAIETLNKICGLYKNKVEVTTDEYVLDLLGAN